MKDWKNAKAGDEVTVPGWGKIKLTAAPYRDPHRPELWNAPGYRWIKSRQKFSGNSYLNPFRLEEPEAYPLSGTGAQKLAWYADRNLLRV